MKELEKQARTVEVEAAIEETLTGAPLLVGYSADLEVTTGRIAKTLRIPASARAEDGSVIYAGNEISGYGNLVLVRHAGGGPTASAAFSTR